MWWLVCGAAFAQSTDPDPLLAADLALGGAVRANPGAFGAALTAPAVLALSPRYSLGVGGRLGSSKVRRVDAGAIDSTTGPVALGAVFVRESYTRDATTDELPGWLQDPEDILNPQTHMSVGGGLALSWLNRRLSVGAGARYWQYSSRFVESEQNIQAYASAAARLGRNVYLSLSGENLVPSDGALVDPVIAAAARFEEASVIALETDLVTSLGADPGLASLHSGAEIWVSEFVPLRLGYQRHFKEQVNILSAGIGAGAPEAILEYGATLELGSQEHTHSLSLRLFL